MEHQSLRIAYRLAAVLRCCIAMSIAASMVAPFHVLAQSFSCTASAGSASGLFSSGSGFLASLSLGAGGRADGASFAGGSAAQGGGAGTQACAPGEAASVAPEAPSTLAGNPVDVVAGTKRDRAIDAYLPSPSADALDDVAELVFSRFYASDSPGSQAIGPGWRLGLDARLYASGAGGPRVFQIVQGDGRSVLFGAPRVSPRGDVVYPARERSDGALERRPLDRAGVGPSVWIWHWRNGRQLVFDDDGRLRRIVSRAGAEIALDYDGGGRLVRVRSAGGRAIGLRYHDGSETGSSAPGSRPAPAGEPAGVRGGRLAALTGSDGEIVRYGYDRAGRLARVEFRDGARIAYDYADEDSHRLVAVVFPDGRRSEYRYAPDGRVVYSRAAGDGESSALWFEYRTRLPGTGSGETRLYVGGVPRATYRWVQPHVGMPARFVSAAGPGCGRCPPTGRSYRYDAGGRLVGVFPGVPGDPGSAESRASLTILRDRQGRPVELRLGSGDDRRTRLTWRDDVLRDVLERIDLPSVVPGLRATVRPVYDGQGRAVAVEQSGFAPVDADDDSPRGPGDASPAAAVPIRRVATSLASLLPVRSENAARPGGGAQARIWRDDFGRVVALRSPEAGWVRRSFDEHDRLRLESRADGSRAHYRYDGKGRLFEYREDPRAGVESPPNETMGATLRIGWSQERIAEIGNASQRENFDFDDAGRVVGRRVALRLESGRVAEFEQRYEYGAQGRLAAWSLPGGGTIRSVQDASGQTVALEWQPTAGAWSMPIVSALERDGYGLRRAVFGNAVEATTRRGPDGRLAEIRHLGTRGPGRSRDVMHHRLEFDDRGGLREWRREPQLRRHLDDDAGRLLQALHESPGGPRVWRFAYDANGNRVLAQQDAGAAQPAARGETPRSTIRDAAGRPLSDGIRSFRWDAGGRLVEVGEAGRPAARYRYDARGLRVAKLVDGVATHFLYDTQRRLLAELDAEGVVRRQYVYLADQPVAVLDLASAAASPAAHRGGRLAYRIRYLHLNHLGAPEAATDERARVIWRAEYAPFGRRLDVVAALAASGPAPRGPQAFELALRLPGQYEDRESGLHYNDHRYYDPDAGRYLSPDPLGLAAGPNPYVYAGNAPLTHIDPSGLLLFAFDGTDNSDPPPRRDDWSNVYKLSRSYSDGRVWYMAGVGRDDAASGIRASEFDAALASTARARVDWMLRELDAAAASTSSRGRPLAVDVVGFSRGAAMARDFSNRVADRIRGGEFSRLGACVQLRFVGLWDTVAQFGANGIANAAWRLSVPAEAAYAAHAVALNEHRTIFPAESIVGSPLAGVRIERGFVGAHADIGGSYAEGDLSDVALVWMHAQAQAAGVRMFALTSEYARVTAPLLHDSNLDRSGDREFRYRNRWGWTYAAPTQRVARVDGLQWRDTDRFIRRFVAPQDDVYGQPTIVGTVEMASYRDWLNANYAISP